ncbi:MAG: HIT domain-containing protein [Minisyncoccia bacterium]|jgi:histidine triad (HIT) family protein
MIDDIFCKIINGEKKDSWVMEGDDWIALNDIHPSATVHVLIIPKKHIASLAEITDADGRLLGNLLLAASKIAKKLKLDKGYRLIVNCGVHGGQVVPHLHFHLLGGEHLGVKIIH